MACGSVDDGKSTLIGRLLAETDSVPDDILDYARDTRRSGSTIPKGEIDFSMLTDGLEAEHEQGITIDVAYRHLYLPSGRRAIIADAPGHEQYTRNMAVAASTADIAILLVDAARGIRPQTHRHLTVCALMGVRTVIVAINKMDAVGFQHVAFEEFAGSIRSAAARFDLENVVVVPVSALTGDNVIDRSTEMPWYHGPTVLEALMSWIPARSEDHAAVPFRFPVQYIVRADTFRGYAGTVVAGSVRPGDKVVVNAKGATTTVERVLVGGEDVSEASADDAVVLTLETETDVTRGDLIVAPGEGLPDDQFPRPATAFAADLVWTGEEELRHGRSYLLLAGSLAVPAVVTAIRNRRDVVSGEEMAARTLKMNDIGHVEIATDTPVPLDPYLLSRDTGGFLLVERVSRDTVAAGLVRHALRRAHNVVPHAFTVDREARATLKNQTPRVLWLTGMPGAGKSTIADALERTLHGLGPAHLRARRRRRPHRPEQGPRLHAGGPGRERPTSGRDRQADGRRGADRDRLPGVAVPRRPAGREGALRRRRLPRGVGRHPDRRGHRARPEGPLRQGQGRDAAEHDRRGPGLRAAGAPRRHRRRRRRGRGCRRPAAGRPRGAPLSPDAGRG